jgi:hypothetical protein
LNRYLGPEDIANEIRIERRYPKKSYTFLLVEGNTDERVYQHFIAKNRCQIIVAHSKENAINALAILEADNFLGVLAIVDADFLILEEKQPSSQNLLLTDMHDLELMMINSPAFEKVLVELGSTDKIAKLEERYKKDLRLLLIECALPIGYLRWVSLREKLSLKFEDLKFERFIDKQKLTVDIMRLIRVVQSHTADNISQKQQLKDDEIHARMQQLHSDSHDPRHVCCGHDVVAILSLALRRAIGSNSSKDVEPDHIEMCLRLAYERSYFSQTRLYAAIQDWEQANAAFVVLRSYSETSASALD